MMAEGNEVKVILNNEFERILCEQMVAANKRKDAALARLGPLADVIEIEAARSCVAMLSQIRDEYLKSTGQDIGKEPPPADHSHDHPHSH